MRYVIAFVFLLVFAPLQLSASDVSEEIRLAPGNLNDIRFIDGMWSDEFDGISQEEPVYLSKNLVFPIPDPFINDSPETAEELRVLFQYARELRTPEQIEKIITEQKGSTDLVFGLGENVPQDIADKVDRIRGEATRDSNHFVYRAKRQYKRARPTQLAPDLTLVIPVPQGPAYPSGHAAISWLGARVFSYIDPKNKIGYMRYAGDVGMRRSISGIHYVSDSAAGRILADQIFEALLDVPEYRRKIDEVKSLYAASAGGGAAVVDLNDIHYPEDRWDPEFLRAIAAGPTIFDPETDFGIEPPPASDSSEVMRELVVLREYAQTYRTEAQVQKIHDENGGSTEILTGGPLIRQFDDNIAFLTLWPKAYAEVTYFLMRAKKHYARPRPTQLAPDLTTVIDVPMHAAYPSGHATHTYLLARLLGAIDLEHEADYKDMAYKIGRRREYAGVHYSSDTRAGIAFADRFFNKLMEVPEFQSELNKAKEEFRLTHSRIND